MLGYLKISFTRAYDFIRYGLSEISYWCKPYVRQFQWQFRWTCLNVPWKVILILTMWSQHLVIAVVSPIKVMEPQTSANTHYTPPQQAAVMLHAPLPLAPSHMLVQWEGRREGRRAMHSRPWRRRQNCDNTEHCGLLVCCKSSTSFAGQTYLFFAIPVLPSLLRKKAHDGITPLHCFPLQKHVDAWQIIYFLKHQRVPRKTLAGGSKSQLQ